jgi:hypothetical protein
MEGDPAAIVVAAISSTTDQSEIIGLPDSDLVTTVMDLVQTIEDAAASDLDPIQHDILEADAIGFDAVVQITYAQLRQMRERELGTDESPVEAVASMLRDSGLDRCAVVGAAKRPLADRVRDRRKRRKWLRTPDGQAYLRTKARRRRRPHHIDPRRAKIARKSARLYSDER